MGQLLAYSIAGHHAGLSNGKEGGQRRALDERLKAKPEQRLYGKWENDLPLPTAAELAQIDSFTKKELRGQLQLSLLGRMIFSCLVDADFLDTEEFYLGVEGEESQRAKDRPSLRELRGQLERKLAGFKADSNVNRWRAEILAHVRQPDGPLIV